MKAKAISLQILDPCSQTWEEMENRGEQRFCESCSKCVIDFSGYSNAEIIKTLTGATTEVCGRLSQTQLNQLNYHLVVAPSTRNWMKYIGILAIGTSFFVNNVQAAVPNKPIVPTIKIDEHIAKKKPDTVKRIYGYVFDENNRPLTGLLVTISNTELYATIDKNGRYEFKLGKNTKLKRGTLQLLTPYYAETTLPINFSRQEQKDLRVKYLPMIMGKIAMVRQN